MPLSISD